MAGEAAMPYQPSPHSRVPTTGQGKERIKKEKKEINEKNDEEDRYSLVRLPEYVVSAEWNVLPPT